MGVCQTNIINTQLGLNPISSDTMDDVGSPASIALVGSPPPPPPLPSLNSKSSNYSPMETSSSDESDSGPEYKDGCPNLTRHDHSDSDSDDGNNCPDLESAEESTEDSYSSEDSDSDNDDDDDEMAPSAVKHSEAAPAMSVHHETRKEFAISPAKRSQSH